MKFKISSAFMFLNKKVEVFFNTSTLISKLFFIGYIQYQIKNLKSKLPDFFGSTAVKTRPFSRKTEHMA